MDKRAEQKGTVDSTYRRNAFQEKYLDCTQAGNLSAVRWWLQATYSTAGAATLDGELSLRRRVPLYSVLRTVELLTVRFGMGGCRENGFRGPRGTLRWQYGILRGPENHFMPRGATKYLDSAA